MPKYDDSVAADPVLAEVLRRLIAAYEPERIYLFGSRARGDAGTDSDYDLLLIVPDDAPKERRHAHLAYRVLWGVGEPVDVVVYSNGFFETRRRLKASLSGIIADEGTLLYAA